MKADIESMISFFERFIKDDTSRVKFLENQEIAFNVINNSSDYLKVYFDILVGIRREEYPNMLSMCFPQRFLGIKNTLDLGMRDTLYIEEILQNCFYFGLLFHLFYMSFPTRNNYGKVNYKTIIADWLPDTLVANIQLRNYNNEADGFPEKCFMAYFTNIKDYENILKSEFKIGFFKRGLAFSFLKNVFYSGILFGICFDLGTK